MQTTIQKFRQSSIVFKKAGILSENLKTLTSSNYLTVQYFCWNFAHVFYLPMSTKEWVGFAFITFRSWVICKNLKRPGFYTLVFYTLLITQDLNKIKKILQPLVDITE